MQNSMFILKRAELDLLQLKNFEKISEKRKWGGRYYISVQKSKDGSTLKISVKYLNWIQNILRSYFGAYVDTHRNNIKQTLKEFCVTIKRKTDFQSPKYEQVLSMFEAREGSEVRGHPQDLTTTVGYPVLSAESASATSDKILLNSQIAQTKFLEQLRIFSKGEISYCFFCAREGIPFNTKMRLLIDHSLLMEDGSYKLEITDLPDAQGGNTGRLRLLMKQEPIQSISGGLNTQLKDPLYRNVLEKTKEQQHWSFRFYDLDRPPPVYPPDLEDVGEELKKTMKQSIDEEYKNKATISGRMSSDGRIGELKSVSIHSKKLSGTQLMKFWDSFCELLAPDFIYLEDDAKFEKEDAGSYNMRLFRYMTTEDKGSWYADSHHYSYFEGSASGDIQDVEDPIRSRIKYFKNMNLSQILTDAKSFESTQSKKVNSGVTDLLRSNAMYSQQSLSLVVSQLGDSVKKGSAVHRTLDTLLSGVIEMYAVYKGEDTRLLQLQQYASFIRTHNCLRKHYLS
jgi:hypothetical protein